MYSVPPRYLKFLRQSESFLKKFLNVKTWTTDQHSHQQRTAEADALEPLGICPLPLNKNSLPFTYFLRIKKTQPLKIFNWVIGNPGSNHTQDSQPLESQSTPGQNAMLSDLCKEEHTGKLKLGMPMLCDKDF